MYKTSAYRTPTRCGHKLCEGGRHTNLKRYRAILFHSDRRDAYECGRPHLDKLLSELYSVVTCKIKKWRRFLGEKGGVFDGEK